MRVNLPPAEDEPPRKLSRQSSRANKEEGGNMAETSTHTRCCSTTQRTQSQETETRAATPPIPQQSQREPRNETAEQTNQDNIPELFKTIANRKIWRLHDSSWRRPGGMCHIIEYSRTVKVKSHDQRSNLMTVNGVVTILSSPNQKARPYQKGEHSRTFEMTTLSGSRENTSTGSSWLNVHGYQRPLNSW